MDNFNFVLPYSVRVADVNYGGHVANSAVLDYFQDARIAYLKHLGGYSELAIGENRGMILADAQVRYRREMFLGDLLRIGVKIVELSASRFVMVYAIERAEEVVVEGTTQLVAFDYQKRRPCRLPEAFRAAVEAFEKI